MRKLISTLILLLFAAPAFAAIVAPEFDSKGILIGIALLAGILGLIKERSRRK